MALNIENIQSAGWAEFGGEVHQLTIAKPTGLAVGDLLVFILGLFGSSGTINEPSIPTGWTEAVELNGTTDERRYLTIMYKIADSSDVAASNFTFSSPSESGNIYGYGSLIRITGHHPTTPVKSALAQSLTTLHDTTTATFGSVSITPDYENSLYIMAAAVNTNGTGAHALQDWAMATDNPTWTEHVDVWTSQSNDFLFGFASAIRSATTAPGNMSYLVSGSTGVQPMTAVVLINPAPEGYFDNVTITESVNVTLIHTKSVSDQITISESATPYIPFNAPVVNDSISISESVSVYPFYPIDVHDTFPLSWKYRQEIVVPASNVSGSGIIENFPVLVDLADLPQHFHDNVKAGGADVRVFSGSTELPREIIYDESTDTGQLWFKANLDGSNDNSFYILYGNADATEPASDDTYGSEAVWSSMSGSYHMSDLTSSTIKDSKGDFDGVKFGGANAPVETDASIGKGQSFDGVSNTGGINAGGAGNNVLDTSLPHSYIGLIYLRSTPNLNRNGIIDKYQETTGVVHYGTALQVSTSRYLEFKIGNGAGAQGQTLASLTQIPLEEWVHVAGVYDGSNLKVYINGVERTTPATISSSNLDGTLRLGNTHHSNGTIDGIVDEALVVPTAVSADYIATDSNNKLSPSTFYTIGDFTDISSENIQTFFESYNININDSVSITDTISDTDQYLLLETGITVDNVNITDVPTVYAWTHGIDIWVDDIEVTDYVEPLSFKVENILTTQVDTARFVVRKTSTLPVEPQPGMLVRIYNEGEKIFAGVVVRSTLSARDYKVIEYEVECDDYTRLLDRKLVADTFENSTASTIIDLINSRYLGDQGFSTAFVNAPSTVITYISFNYNKVSECLTQLADLLQCDWYVDYDKNIHFFTKDERNAPFSLNDSNGSYIFSSLRIRRDNSQVRNKIFVQGGTYLGSTVTSEYISDGTQNVYNLDYQYDDIQVSVTGTVWDGGIDTVDAPSLFDYIWNNDEKFIRFRGDRIPTDTSLFRISGRPYLPVRVIVQDDDSIQHLATAEGGNGVYEYVIVDRNINSQEGARERALAELESYKDTLSEGEFTTYTSGLKAGQQIRIESDAFGIDEYFMINRVTTRMQDNRTVVYQVSLVTTKTFGVIEFLQSILNQNKKEIVLNTDEIIDVIRSFPESISVDESVTEQALDYAVQFVAGPLASPSGTKRLFFTNISPLGRHMNPVFDEGINITESVTVSIS